MRKFFLSALLLGTTSIAFAPSALAQDVSISGGLDAKNRYTLGDFLYDGSDAPVAQGYVDASIKLSDDIDCRASSWGNLPTNNVGKEIDLGGGCTIQADKNTTVTVTATRYLLLDKGVPDMTAFTSTVTHGPIDINVGYYLWDTLPSGASANIGYTHKVKAVDGLTVRGSLHYAHGLGDDDIVFAGAKASYPLVKNVTLSGQVYTPLIKTARDKRDTRAIVALSYSF